MGNIIKVHLLDKLDSPFAKITIEGEKIYI